MEEKRTMTTSGFPSLENAGADAWLEYGRGEGVAHQLLLSFPFRFCQSRIETGFWLEFSTPQGPLMGWMRFEFLTSLRGQAIFAAAEWRPAHGPAPRPEGVWLGASAPRQVRSEAPPPVASSRLEEA